jgi:hypothetical protein
LEHPNDFAGIFACEWGHLQAIAFRGIQIRIELSAGIRLISASGYSINISHGAAIFTPGDLFTGQEPNFYPSRQVPTDMVGTIAKNGVSNPKKPPS